MGFPVMANLAKQHIQDLHTKTVQSAGGGGVEIGDILHGSMSTGGPPPSHAYPLKARRLEALGQNRILKRFCFRARPVLVFDFPSHVTATGS